MSRGLHIYLNDFYYKHPAGKAQTMYPLNTSHCFGVQRTEPPHGGEPPWNLLTGSTVQFKHTQQSIWCCVCAPRAFQEQLSLSLGFALNGSFRLFHPRKMWHHHILFHVTGSSFPWRSLQICMTGWRFHNMLYSFKAFFENPFEIGIRKHLKTPLLWKL